MLVQPSTVPGEKSPGALFCRWPQSKQRPAVVGHPGVSPGGHRRPRERWEFESCHPMSRGARGRPWAVPSGGRGQRGAVTSRELAGAGDLRPGPPGCMAPPCAGGAALWRQAWGPRQARGPVSRLGAEAGAWTHRALDWGAVVSFDRYESSLTGHSWRPQVACLGVIPAVRRVRSCPRR